MGSRGLQSRYKSLFRISRLQTAEPKLHKLPLFTGHICEFLPGRLSCCCQKGPGTLIAVCNTFRFPTLLCAIAIVNCHSFQESPPGIISFGRPCWPSSSRQTWRRIPKYSNIYLYIHVSYTSCRELPLHVFKLVVCPVG